MESKDQSMRRQAAELERIYAYLKSKGYISRNLKAEDKQSYIQSNIQSNEDWGDNIEYDKSDEAVHLRALITQDTIIHNPVKLNNSTGCTYQIFLYCLNKVKKKIMSIPERPLFFEDSLSAKDPENIYRLHIRYALLMTLMRIKGSPTQGQLSASFDISPPIVSSYLAFMRSILQDILPTARKLFKKMHKDSSVVKKLIPDNKILIDGTVTPVQRLEDAQQEVYSDKNKHGYNTLILANTDGMIIGASTPAEGSSHDMAVLDKFKPELDGLFNSLGKKAKNLQLYSDKGFIGIDKRFPNISMKQSSKKPKSGPLIGKENSRNKKINRIRIGVEHTIERIKRFGVTTTPYDDTIEEFDVNMQIVTGLVNLKLAHRHKKYQWLFDL